MRIGSASICFKPLFDPEWVTWFWLRELVGWATTPLLVAVALSLALPLAAGRSGFWPPRRSASPG